jgi:hypothetical protein
MQSVMSRHKYKAIHRWMRIVDKNNFETVFERIRAKHFNVLC